MLPLENSWTCKRQNQEPRSFLFLSSPPVSSARRWLTAPDSPRGCWERNQQKNGGEDGESRFIVLGEQVEIKYNFLLRFTVHNV